MGIAGSWAGGAGYRAAWLLWLAGDAEKKAAFVVCPDARELVPDWLVLRVSWLGELWVWCCF